MVGAKKVIKWIDKNTAVSSDGSIFLIDSEGSIEFYPGRGWKKPDRNYAGRPSKKSMPFFHLRIKDAELSRKVINLLTDI